MKMNPIGIIVVILAIGVVVYYFHHHQVNIDVKGDRGSKSHTSIKYDAPKHEDRA